MPMHYECRCDECRCEMQSEEGLARGSVSAAGNAGATYRDAAKNWIGKGRHSCAAAGAVEEPPVGAHLVTPRRGFTHRGIYAGSGRVIHYAGLSKGISRGPVEEVTLERFARQRPVLIQCRGPLPFEPMEVVQRARSRLGENRYRLLSNNCEHFSEWSQYGRSHSEQIERWLRPATSTARRLAAFARALAAPMRIMSMSWASAGSAESAVSGEGGVA